MRSDDRNARRGVMGGLGVVSARTGWACCGGALIPALALSRCCAADSDGTEQSKSRETRRMAGECGNRTHPTLRSRVTVILKITEATRPHPPPRVSLNFDRNFSPFGDFADDCGPRNA